MNHPPIRYRGVELHHNPKSIQIEENKSYSEHFFVNALGAVQESGRKARVVSGEGEFFGKDCLTQYNAVLELFTSREGGLLSVSGYTPFYARFVLFTLTQPPLENFLSYRFVFIEDMSLMPQGIKVRQRTHTVTENQTLWDIAYLYGIPVESLLINNPGISRPDALTSGQEVKLL